VILLFSYSASLALALMIIDEQQGVHFGFFSASTQYLLKYLQINKQNVGENAIRSFELMNREQDCAECTTWL